MVKWWYFLVVFKSTLRFIKFYCIFSYPVCLWKTSGDLKLTHLQTKSCSIIGNKTHPPPDCIWAYSLAGGEFCLLNFASVIKGGIMGSFLFPYLGSSRIYLSERSAIYIQRAVAELIFQLYPLPPRSGKTLLGGVLYKYCTIDNSPLNPFSMRDSITFYRTHTPEGTCGHAKHETENTKSTCSGNHLLLVTDATV